MYAVLHVRLEIEFAASAYRRSLFRPDTSESDADAIFANHINCQVIAVCIKDTHSAFSRRNCGIFKSKRPCYAVILHYSAHTVNHTEVVAVVLRDSHTSHTDGIIRLTNHQSALHNLTVNSQRHTSFIEHHTLRLHNCTVFENNSSKIHNTTIFCIYIDTGITHSEHRLFANKASHYACILTIDCYLAIFNGKWNIYKQNSFFFLCPNVERPRTANSGSTPELHSHSFIVNNPV